VRHYLEAYDRVMAGQSNAHRQLTEGSLAGLRLMRNRIGDEAVLAEFIKPGESGPGPGHITGWPAGSGSVGHVRVLAAH
jgi:hypothetical protein